MTDFGNIKVASFTTRPFARQRVCSARNVQVAQQFRADDMAAARFDMTTLRVYYRVVRDGIRGGARAYSIDRSTDGVADGANRRSWKTNR